MIYEYQCKKCELVFKMTRPLAEYKEDGTCTECGEKCKRVLSTPMFKTCGGGHKPGTIK
jgi:putative FmdB family regulatory protein